MEKNELKRQMMNLWKETFHDSDEYIRLVFDEYFDPEYVEYEERDGRIIACLLAIPYTFGNDNYTINSVYLCGLSTYYKNRGEGIMTQLIQKIEKRMRQKGYSFMFLIPANSGLRRYYKDRGFINGFYRSALHYTSLHDFKRDFYSSISTEENALFEVKKRYFDGLSVEIIDRMEGLNEESVLNEITDFIFACENKQKGLTLFQSVKQIKVFLKETILSGGRIVICRNNDGEYAAVGLYSISENEIKENGRYATNYGSLCKIRETVILTGGGRNLTVYQYGYEKKSQKEAVWNPMYSSFSPDAPQVGSVGIIERVYNPNSNSEIYGMIRILSMSEILIFLSNWRRDLKYSILMRRDNDGEIIEFSSKNGHVIQSNIRHEVSSNEESDAWNKNKKILYIRDLSGKERMVLTERDLGEILFRRPGCDRMVEEAFDLPAMNGRISLLLD